MTTSSLFCLCAALFTLPGHTDFISKDYRRYNDGKLGNRPNLNFFSSQEYSPVLQVNTWNGSAISDHGSHIFLRHDGEASSHLSSPLILDANDLSTVFVNRSYENVFGTRVQENFGKKYLTFWAGKKGYGIGNGFGLVFDDTYRLVYNISAQGIATHSDLHEFALTGHGTALVTGVDDVLVDTSGWKDWKGPAAFPVLDALFQEIVLDTGEVLFSWRALDHISPMESFEMMAKNWDAFHLNSVQKTQAGNYLVSIRHTNSILLINGTTGDIIWTMGGKQNDFTELAPAKKGANPLPPVLSMGWQHHARYVPYTNETEMTFFDNHVKETSHGNCRSACSRGLHIAINDTASPPTVQLLQEYTHPSRLQAQSQGSVQVLGAARAKMGNVFVGWGRCPSFTEHTPSGETVMDVQFSPWHGDNTPDALDNYRAYKMDWVATPWWDPALAVRDRLDGNLSVYVSWNGATEVRAWVVRGGTGDELARSPRAGFETRLIVRKMGVHRLWADALDRRGVVIGSTPVLDLVHGNVTILEDSEEPDWTFTQAPTRAAISASTWALMGAGLLGLVILMMGGITLWRRHRGYNHLNDDDSELDLDTDVDMVFGLDYFSNELPPEPWQEYVPRSYGPKSNM